MGGKRNKKRILQVCILLLFTLGIAVGSFYMVKMETETVWKIEADEINTDRLLRELALREEWKTVLRKAEVPH